MQALLTLPSLETQDFFNRYQSPDMSLLLQRKNFICSVFYVRAPSLAQMIPVLILCGLILVLKPLRYDTCSAQPVLSELSLIRGILQDLQ
jgi:hypothetical protein